MAGCTSCSGQKESGNNYLILEKIIPLPDVSGRIDHLAFNETRQLIYIAALGNNTVEIIDLPGGKIIHSIKGLDEPQGIEYLSFSNTIFVANGGTGICSFFDADSFQPITNLNFKDDADDVRYFPPNKTVYVGYGNGGIGVISEQSKIEMGRIAFYGHPEGFQVDFKSNKIWVNVPSANAIRVLDGNSFKVLDEWKIKDLSANFPMAYDSISHLLFIAFRSPSRLVVFDSETGNRIASLPCAGDADDVFYDADMKRIIISGGSGYTDVFKKSGEKVYSLISHIASRKGARTSLWIPSVQKFVLAVPRSGGQSAELRVYKMIQ